MDEFQKQKNRCLSSTDNSIKGSIDAKILSLVQLINENKDYFTTSSCSGRIMIFRKVNQLKSKNCESLFVTHDSITEDDVNFLLNGQIEDSVIFKFEPFVLHVQCRTMNHARLLLKVALTSGFRNSGIVLGKKERLIVAVRSTQTLEVPLTNQGAMLISQDKRNVRNQNQVLDEAKRIHCNRSATALVYIPCIILF
ncbi:uncharacterized protein TRIADDRAFT_53200 [Trichoplax adhaerens]|uniref:tRNA wybutosine-synthesizing protein 3 homolog n=1 Tax=Trichoplax adhaerens TaxID=10228 RepID=B3RNK7_TRIAD|nr:hypothetical protein TRIADDRAFT_53200 [Trichoplax adhaerens]EDV27472.1 hypothetical protein TRIADDRAFT_53200 [Trichoplax adhaerens]|eukprot:XP_002109306.1 hypothetical protein TRIADDRAFT_53200 [Trichoplax adhaerens]